MMASGEIRGWLLKQPRPVVLRVTDAESRTHQIDCTAGDTWASIAESCAALQPELVEALDAKANLVRAIRPNDAPPASSSSSSSSTARPGADPETERFRVFAECVADAYKDSREFTQTAFDKLVELVEAGNKEAAARNRELENLMRLLRREWEDKLANTPDPEPDALTQIASAFIQGQEQGASDKPTNGKG